MVPSIHMNQINIITRETAVDINFMLIPYVISSINDLVSTGNLTSSPFFANEIILI